MQEEVKINDIEDTARRWPQRGRSDILMRQMWRGQQSL